MSRTTHTIYGRSFRHESEIHDRLRDLVGECDGDNDGNLVRTPFVSSLLRRVWVSGSRVIQARATGGDYTLLFTTAPQPGLPCV